ncbi:tRNA (cytidine(34)-2'-O)-methyltransferase [Spirochaeta cellobiosiphila]|uniref:tRNA (cytidine(34)-2'-O)-methyltransferase n=1 Tax=Spirochaeta cellobiosiphila TaxID=504483 RepID=UPI000428CDCB|nr:tRNA (cytidine(34)-2'-O)-methyltransferase [Spirochaeta cellobiosiphila]
MALNIVLVEPEIPQNTGNIARTCAALGVTLHLIEPLGFKIDEKQVRRAGLDYWPYLTLHTYPNLDDFFAKNPGIYYMATTKAEHTYSDPQYSQDQDVYLMFGKESAGLPEELLVQHRQNCVRIPMKEVARSLNLSNAVAIMSYEVMRQWNFPTLEEEGQLHRLKWNDEGK